MMKKINVNLLKSVIFDKFFFHTLDQVISNFFTDLNYIIITNSCSLGAVVSCFLFLYPFTYYKNIKKKVTMNYGIAIASEYCSFSSMHKHLEKAVHN